MEKKYTYDYPRALVTVDIIVTDNNNKLLLIKRANNPYKNMWAFPGGFIEMNERLVDSAKRELFEETSLQNIELKQFKAYGDLGRDPRGRNIAVVFHGKYTTPELAKAGDDASESKWFDIQDLPKMAFDHGIILREFLGQ